MRMMANGGRLLVDETCKGTVRRWKENGEDVVKKFKYKLPFDLHFCYCCAVDDHNNLRHTLPSIEDRWVTDWWECRVFAFILAISEVNAFFDSTLLFLLWVTLGGVAYATVVSSEVGMATFQQYIH